ncbi:MAG: HNH endonuclease, partial [Propionibacteriaceae bacterium]|nr:HNH endonuclease [Propionibacteriaceae bacterium]
MRRLIRRRHQRLAKFDQTLTELGLPIIDLATNPDPYHPWKVRNSLVERQVSDLELRDAMLSVALRHMVRHRGWRSPYASVASLHAAKEPSPEFRKFIASVSAKTGQPVDPELTVAQIVFRALDTKLRPKIRGAGGILEDKVHQSDNVRELARIWQTQALPAEWFQKVVNSMFYARSPKGSAAARVGHDPLDRRYRRAEKASLAFQRFRVTSIVANLRIKESGEERPLTAAERREAVSFLWGADSATVTWDDVATRLGVSRRGLVGTAQATADGERAGARPPINVTGERIRDSKIAELKARWNVEDTAGQEAIIAALSNGASLDDVDPEAFNRASEFIASLPEETLGKVDDLRLPEGRAAYSASTLRRLTRRMEASEDDLHQARKAEFGVDDSWHPPAVPIGEPVGNPAVDRVLKIFARWLAAVETKWGPPLSVNIEHTRDGLISEATARKIDRENNQRAARNQELQRDMARHLQELRAAQSLNGAFFDDDEVLSPSASRARIARYRAFTRQQGRCLYCGTPLEFMAMELDHIVPRAGQGATNAQVNLAAVCGPCNRSKGKVPFTVWASKGERPGVTLEGAIQRSREMFGLGRKSRDEAAFISAVVARLKRTDSDEEIDNRSIEAVGWMANELRARVDQHFRDQDAATTVNVFRGQITSDARKASGIEGRMMLIGGAPGKNRLDRRHHALDAATIAMLRPGVAQALAVRSNLRRSQELAGRRPDEDSWKEFRGTNPELFDQWKVHMVALAGLVQEQLDEDRVPVFEFLRLKLGSSKGHEDIIRSFRGRTEGGQWVPTPVVRVGDQIAVDTIDRSATPAQWIALTRAPGYDPEVGLPADSTRRIRVQHSHLGPDDVLDFFPTSSGCVAVRFGYSELGAAFHHARIYRCIKLLKSGKQSPFYAMMRVYQVDLLRHRAEDLFAVDIPPQAISRRAAEPRLREALAAGRAEYMGWLVTGDELLLDMSSQHNGAVGELLEAFPNTNRWSVDGFFNPARLRLRPKLLSAEGLQDDSPPGVRGLIEGGGWRPSISVVFGDC